MPFTKVTDNLLSSGVGTGANNLVELDSSGNLPAVNGSAVTTLTSGNLTGALPAIDGANLTAIPVVTEAMIHPDAVVKFISGRKNLLLNGGFDVSQRGDFTSATNITTGDYYLDRFKQGLRLDGITAATVTHKTNQVLPNGSYVNSLLMTLTVVTSPVSSWCNTQQIVEEFNKLKGQTVTLSAWVKSNIATSINIYDGVTQTHSSSHTGGGQWEKLTVTQTISTISTLMLIEIWTNDNRVLGDYFEIAQVQLEIGDQATDFEHRSYGEELALCQRYYQTGDFERAPTNSYASTYFAYHINFPTQMRVVPTVLSPLTGIRNFTILSNGVIYPTLTGYSASPISNEVTTLGYGTFVIGSYTADAEL